MKDVDKVLEILGRCGHEGGSVVSNGSFATIEIVLTDLTPEQVEMVNKGKAIFKISIEPKSQSGGMGKL